MTTQASYGAEYASDHAESDDATENRVEQTLSVFLLIGQANMAGRAPIPASQATIIADTYLLNATEDWEPAIHPLNRHSTVRKELSFQGFGPG